MGDGGEELGKAQIPIRATLDKLDGDLEQARKKIESSLGGTLAAIGNKVAALGKAVVIGGAVAAAAAVAGIGKAAFDSAMKLDEAYDKIEVGTGAVGKVLDGLKDDFKAVFKSVPANADIVSGAIAALNSRLGATGQPLQDMARGLALSANLMGGDAVANAASLTRVMGDWSIKTADGARTLDKFFVAQQKTGAGMDSLMQKVVQFGSPLRLMGFGLDESIALFGKWEKEGVNAELVMGSLRIAAGKFAKEQGGTTKTIKGGVPSLAKASTTLAKLQEQLRLATMRQSEFTDKTKGSTRAAAESKIGSLTAEITTLGEAMAKGEDRTIEMAGANKSLRDSLMESIESIKNNKDATAALAQGMEIFGARAGPDMVAAIREGRFAADDLVAALAGTQGAIENAAGATEDWPEKWEKLKNKATVALAPLGTKLMEIAGNIMDVADRLVRLSESPAIAALGQRLNEALGDALGPMDRLLEWMDKYLTAQDKLANIEQLPVAIQPQERQLVSQEIDALTPDWMKAFQGAGIGGGMEFLSQAFLNWSSSPATKDQMYQVGVSIGSAIIEGVKSTKPADADAEPLSQGWLAVLSRTLVNAGRGAGEGNKSMFEGLIASLFKTESPGRQAAFAEKGKQIFEDLWRVLDIRAWLQTGVLAQKALFGGSPFEWLLTNLGLLPTENESAKLAKSLNLKPLFDELLKGIGFGPSLPEGIGNEELASAVLNQQWLTIEGDFMTFKANFTLGMDGLKASFTSAWDSITSSVSTAYTTLKTDLDSIAAAFKNIKIEWPHIPLPHISSSLGEPGLFGVQLPTFSIAWYAKGLDAIINRPTVIGVGERGPERVTVTPEGKDSPWRTGDMENAPNGITLPAWLMPGSPSPFEMRLPGISDAPGEMPGLLGEMGTPPAWTRAAAVTQITEHQPATAETPMPERVTPLDMGIVSINNALREMSSLWGEMVAQPAMRMGAIMPTMPIQPATSGASMPERVTPPAFREAPRPKAPLAADGDLDRRTESADAPEQPRGELRPSYVTIYATDGPSVVRRLRRKGATL